MVRTSGPGEPRSTCWPCRWRRRARRRHRGRLRRGRGRRGDLAEGTPRDADLAGPGDGARRSGEAINVGIEVADRLIDAGADLLLTGDMGIGNTTPSACLIAAFTGTSADLVTGRGTGIDDEMLASRPTSSQRAATVSTASRTRSTAGRSRRSRARRAGRPRPRRRCPPAARATSTASSPAPPRWSPSGSLRTPRLLLRRPPQRRTRARRGAVRSASGRWSTSTCAWGRGAAPLLAVPWSVLPPWSCAEMATFDSAGVANKDV